MIVAICWPYQRAMTEHDVRELDRWFAENAPRPPERFDVVAPHEASPVFRWAREKGHAARVLPDRPGQTLGPLLRNRLRGLADAADVFVYWCTPSTPRGALMRAFERQRDPNDSIELVPIAPRIVE